MTKISSWDENIILIHLYENCRILKFKLMLIFLLCNPDCEEEYSGAVAGLQMPQSPLTDFHQGNPRYSDTSWKTEEKIHEWQHFDITVQLRTAQPT